MVEKDSGLSTAGDINRRQDIAYYYPAPFWMLEETAWVKTLLLFFDRVSVLLPDYMYGRHHLADPALAEPLEELGLLEVLEPKVWVDEEVATSLTDAMMGFIYNGSFDDLESANYFAELSQSRMGFAADIQLAESLVSELQSRGLAKPSEDGVSIPLHPTVRTTILVILAQLARAAGNKRNLNIHPATQDGSAIDDLIETLSKERMASRDSVIAFDLEAVSFDLDPVPLDELLQFREETRGTHRAYMRDLRAFMDELAEYDDPNERRFLLLERRQEISDAAHDLQRTTRRAFKLNLPSWSLGIAGSVWSAANMDPLGAVLSAAGLFTGRQDSNVAGASKVSAYSYLFRVARTFNR